MKFVKTVLLIPILGYALSAEFAHAQCGISYGYFGGKADIKVRDLAFCASVGGRAQSREYKAANHACNCTNPYPEPCEWRDDAVILANQISALRQIFREDTPGEESSAWTTRPSRTATVAGCISIRRITVEVQIGI